MTAICISGVWDPPPEEHNCTENQSKQLANDVYNYGKKMHVIMINTISRENVQQWSR